MRVRVRPLTSSTFCRTPLTRIVSRSNRSPGGAATVNRRCRLMQARVLGSVMRGAACSGCGVESAAGPDVGLAAGPGVGLGAGPAVGIGVG